MPAKRPLLFEYVNIGVGFIKAEVTAPPVPIGPAEAERLPPIVKLPPLVDCQLENGGLTSSADLEKALTASSLLRTTTNSDRSAPAFIAKEQY